MRKTGMIPVTLVSLMLLMALTYTSAQAQQQPTPPRPTTVRINNIDGRDPPTSMQVTGKIVGFSCATNSIGNITCFVATTD